ncbi:hypothetical protein HY256_05010, partial [Candidatus Sumerlaeota bacterium]|nr:hypothetical protein [Candidatus Sumerlaeota bacterium]
MFPHSTFNTQHSAFLFLLIFVFAFSPLCVSESFSQPPLPGGAAPLTETRDLVDVMLDGLHEFLDEKTSESLATRKERWHQDFSSPEAYEKSIEPNRERFRRIIGAIHPVISPVQFQYIADAADRFKRESSSEPEARRVRWPVFDGVEGEGILISPTSGARYVAIVIPDAGETTENTARLYGMTLARAGGLVLVPLIANLADDLSANASLQKITNQPHREFLYRMNYELGSHIIGLEVEMIQAAATALQAAGGTNQQLPLGVCGYGEGGLIALYAGAVDARIDVAGVSGYFNSRQELWREPIYRNVWGLLDEFGDAEIAGLIVPRRLIIEACGFPSVEGPPAPEGNRRGAAPGQIKTPDAESIRGEFARARTPYDRLNLSDHFELITNRDGKGGPFSGEMLDSFIRALGLKVSYQPPPITRSAPIPSVDSNRFFTQLVEFTQKQMRLSHFERDAFWEKMVPNLKAVKADQWSDPVEPLRKYFSEEVIGHFPPPTI